MSLRARAPAFGGYVTVAASFTALISPCRVHSAGPTPISRPSPPAALNRNPRSAPASGGAERPPLRHRHGYRGEDHPLSLCFGDDWQHVITPERWFENTDTAGRPFLLEAFGRRLPEDFGGPGDMPHSWLRSPW
jgi:hypothetical protein